MDKILLDGKEVGTLVPESLPMLIHGEEGSGASLYTIALAAKWYSQGYGILFLCGYHMAEEEFRQQVGGKYDKAAFYTKDKLADFKRALHTEPANTIVIIKNIELFNESVIEIVGGISNVIISGDVGKSDFKNKILAKEFITKVYFSSLDINMPELNKYEGLVTSDGY
jgi:hypothetical protein